MSSDKWYYHAGECGDVVVSTRVRLARNIEGYPFSQLLTSQGLWEITERFLNAMKVVQSKLNLNLRYLPMETQTTNQKAAMVEHHLISPQFAKATNGAILISEDDSISMMIGEEDHLRMQVLAPGFDIENAYKTINQIDQNLSGQLPFAFDKKLGYLTQCPTNLGCALRISVMMHLPALEQTGALQNMIAGAHRLGLTVRGTYGEGSAAEGCFYQISNERSLGLSEEEIIQTVKGLVEQIILAERHARERFVTDREAFEDQTCRALGTLKYARLLSHSQLLSLCSLVRLGISMHSIDEIGLDTVEKLINQTGAGAVCEALGADLTPRERDYARAKMTRDMLSQA